MSVDWQLKFEQAPGTGPRDETDYALRAYVAGLLEESLGAYDPDWTDEQVMEWDGNFRSDGALMLVCCERDVGVAEFRGTIEEFLRFRAMKRDKTS